MKDPKKSRHKRSYSPSHSSSKSSSRSSSIHKHKHKKSHKSKQSRDHKTHKQQKYNERERQTKYDQSRNKHTQMNKFEYKDQFYNKRQQSSLNKHEQIMQSQYLRNQLPQQNHQPIPQKQLPCFQPSGILLQYYNTRQGVSLRFHQPPQSRQPDQQWRMYIFKGQEVLQPIVLTKSSYLVGKDQRVVDILAQNPSISRQHAVIQFRLIQKRQTQGEFIEETKPYVMDLESTNGTVLNDQKIQPGRYYELLHRDVLKFGFSDREYVLVKWEENQEE